MAIKENKFNQTINKIQKDMLLIYGEEKGKDIFSQSFDEDIIKEIDELYLEVQEELNKEQNKKEIELDI